MDFYKATLTRLQNDDKQTLGALTIWCGTDEVFSCKTLELKWNDNKPFTSCIPKGRYSVIPRHSGTYGYHFHVTNVDNRSLILIHAGNSHRDTEGCICVGRDYHDVNNDGYLDVTSSQATMRALNNAITVNKFNLTVV